LTLRVAVSALPYDDDGVAFVVEADRLGLHSVWVPEAWGYDALTPLAYLAAKTANIKLGTGIAQLGARTPAMLAMSAMSLQALSGGRFILGLGTSGPQVMEGWHGVAFRRPIQRTRETIEIIRSITRGDKLAYQGETYTLPLPGGEGRSIRSMAPPVDVPIYIAALGPANLRLTGELADGWIGNSFFPDTAEVFFEPMRAAAVAAGRSLDDVDLNVAASVEFSDDVEEVARKHARGYAFTFGAMGSKDNNFYKDAFTRQGFGADVDEVQRLWLAGDREAAAARVPLEIGLNTNLIGTPPMVKERLVAYRDAGVDTLRVGLAGAGLGARLDTLGLLLDLVAEVNDQSA
jgi:F420-dependent oxidoreductase-like protein